jgi:hypothetical protein
MKPLYPFPCLLAMAALTLVPVGAADSLPPMLKDAVPSADTPTCIFVDEPVLFPTRQSVVSPSVVLAEVLEPLNFNGDNSVLDAEPDDGFALDVQPETRLVYLDFQGLEGQETPQTEDDRFLYRVTGSKSYGCSFQSTLEYIVEKLLLGCPITNLPCMEKTEVHKPPSSLDPLLGAGADYE